MTTDLMTILAGGLLIYALVSKACEKYSVTPPMLALLLGILVAITFVPSRSLQESLPALLVEVTLILVLFTDASRIHLKQLIKKFQLPLRMLLLGMPLMIFFGAILAYHLFEISIPEALLLAGLLAPTDAALGQGVMFSRWVPETIRQTINVESGLNDGLALPVILILIHLWNSTPQTDATGLAQDFATMLFKQIILGVGIGLFVAFLSTRLLVGADRRHLVSDSYRYLALLGMGFLAYGASELLGGNGFMAAFCAGLWVSHLKPSYLHKLHSFADAEGQLLSLLVFFLLGLSLPESLAFDQWPKALLYAGLSLGVIRPLAMGLSLIRARLEFRTQLFLGWFGPRGLASILFLLLAQEQLKPPQEGLFAHVVIVTVSLSIFCHGLTATPLSYLYGKSIGLKKDERREWETSPTFRMRHRQQL